MTRQRFLVGLVGLLIGAMVTGFIVDRDKRLTIWLAKRCHDRPQLVYLLLDYYKNGNEPVKERVLKTFARLGEDVSPDLIEIIKNGDSSSQAGALSALTRIDRSAVQRLIVEMFKDDDPVLLAKAAATAVQAGEKIVPLLLNLISNPDRQVRWWVATTLGKIGGNDSRVGEAFKGILVNDTDVSVCTAAASALGDIGSAAIPFVPNLVKALEHVDPGLRAAAARALGRIGCADPDALAHLTAALTDEDTFVRENAWAAIMKIQDPRP